MRLLALAVTLLLSAVATARAAGGDVPWRAWSETLFEEAARDDRFVLLNMAAVWCHWCHVMDRTTYSDPNVLAKLAEKYIPVRVDQDARPDLSYCYENFGWPATIVLDGAGNEVLRRRGYVPPEVFLKLLQIAIDDPSSLPDAMAEPAADPNVVQLTAAHRQKLDEIMLGLYDRENGGFGTVHRFVAADAIEYALVRGRHGQVFADMARRTLAGARSLIDPVWGGMYQYSDALDWSSPHYEKIMAIQVRRPAAEARGLLAKPVRQLDENVAATRFFNLLARYTGDPAHRRAAEHGMSWLVGFADLEVFAPGIQLADHEITREPVHAAVVGAKDDPMASALHVAARAYPARFLRLDWWDRREGLLSNPDVVYPELPDAAAFACADQVCSLPVFAADDVHAAIRLVDRR